MVAEIKPLLQDWKFAAISVGFPAPVRDGRIMSEPKHLGRDGSDSISRSRLANQSASSTTPPCRRSAAIMDGGCFFLGLALDLDRPWCGTITCSHSNWEICPMAMVHHRRLPWQTGPGRLGEKNGDANRRARVFQLKKSLIADYIVLGGGNAKKLDVLPKGIERGHNRNAFLGGTRFWEIDSRTRRAKWQIL